MTVSEITQILVRAGIEDARHEAMLIMSEYAGKSVASLRADPKFDFTSPEMENTIARRAERYPLQYLFGKWEFCGLTFRVNEHCLIPRPETEHIVEELIKKLTSEKRQHIVSAVICAVVLGFSYMFFTDTETGFIRYPKLFIKFAV